VGEILIILYTHEYKKSFKNIKVCKSWLKLGTKSSKRKILKDQNLLNFFIGTKKKIQEIYRTKNILNPTI
jgi:hypothetical protein